MLRLKDIVVKLGTMSLESFKITPAQHKRADVGVVITIRRRGPGEKPFKVRVDDICVGFIRASVV